MSRRTKTRLWNELLCVEWAVKLGALTLLLTLAVLMDCTLSILLTTYDRGWSVARMKCGWSKSWADPLPFAVETELLTKITLRKMGWVNSGTFVYFCSRTYVAEAVEDTRAKQHFVVLKFCRINTRSSVTAKIARVSLPINHIRVLSTTRTRA